MNENHSSPLIVLIAVHNKVFYFSDPSFHDNLVFDLFFQSLLNGHIFQN